MTRVARAVRHPVATVAVWTLLAALAAPGLLELEHDNSPEVYFVRDAVALADYEDFRGTFGDLGALRVAATGAGLWSPAGLAWLADFERRAPGVPGVMGAAGPWGRARDLLGPEAFSDPLLARATLAADPLATAADLLADGGEAVTVLLALGDLDPDARRRTLAELEELLAGAPADIAVTLAGLATVNRALDRELGRILTRLFPLVVLLAAAVVTLALGSATDTARLLLFAAFCLVVTVGGMGHLGLSLNVVTSVVPLLVFVLALATAVHVLIDVRARVRRRREPEVAVRETYGRKAWPVAWMALTTGAAFASLGWSDSPPVAELGLATAAGIGIVLLAALTLWPAILSRRRAIASGCSRFEKLARGLGLAAAAYATRRPRGVGGLFAVVFLAALAGLPRIEVETGVLAYFSRLHPARSALEAVEELGVGAVSAEIVLDLPDGLARTRFDESPWREGLGRATSSLRSLPGVLGAVSAADLGAPEEVDAASPFVRRARSLLLSADGDRARISLFVPFAGFTRLEPLFESALIAVRRELPGVRTTLTGHYPMVLAAQRQLLATMIFSLAVTLVVVAAISSFLARGPRLAAATLVPNLLPVVVVLGAMGWLGIAIDGATLMVGAVVLGVAADDTLHFLGGLRHVAGRGAARRVRTALARVAPAQLLTTLVLVLGFTALATSRFLPVARFGALAAAGLVVALAADWLAVPALASWAGRRALDRLSAGARRDR